MRLFCCNQYAAPRHPRSLRSRGRRFAAHVATAHTSHPSGIELLATATVRRKLSYIINLTAMHESIIAVKSPSKADANAYRVLLTFVAAK